MEEEKILRKILQQFPRLKFKKYLQFRIFNVYFCGYLEINRLIICLSCKFKKKIQINIFSENIPHALLIEETVQLLATPTHK